MITACTIHPSLLQSFEPGDQRKTSWFGLNKLSGQNYYYPLKYKIVDNSPNTPLEYSMVMRLAEIYLIRAEARARQNNLAGGLADLDSVRVRAGLAVAAANDQATLLQAIE